MKLVSKNPIIFLPGLMGSIGGEMIPGINAWSFGIAKWIYDPMIDGLENIGYRRGQNLFICYYDWRKQPEEIVEKYLLPTIEEVRNKYPNQPIDIISHSMGGIVARTYIQGNYYKGNVERLIMMGTPHRGSIDAYYLWSTGTLVPAKRKNFSKILYRGYIWLLTKIFQIPLGVKDINRLHENFRGLSALIPSSNYGDFLMVDDGENQLVRVPRKYINYENNLLDHLNNQIDLLKSRVKEIYCYAGTGSETNNLLVLDRRELIYQGQEVIRDVLTTIQGDNTVTLNSASIDGVENMIIPTSHRGIVKDSLRHVATIYGVDIDDIEVTSKGEGEETLHILFRGDIGFTLELDQNNILTYENHRVTTTFEYLKEEFEGNFGWVALKNITKGHYAIRINSSGKQGINILVMSTEVEEEYSDQVSFLNNQRVITFRI